MGIKGKQSPKCSDRKEAPEGFFPITKAGSPQCFLFWLKYISIIEAYVVGENSGFANALVLRWWRVGWGEMFNQSEHFLLRILG